MVSTDKFYDPKRCGDPPELILEINEILILKSEGFPIV